MLLPDGSSCRYLRRRAQGLVSSGLRELCLYVLLQPLELCRGLVKLVERVSGEERLLCEQTLWNWAQEKASEVSAALCSEIAAARSV